MYKRQIISLHQRFMILDKQIAIAKEDKDLNKDALNALITEQITVQSELRRLEKLQWEEDHERVNFEDDR